LFKVTSTPVAQTCLSLPSTHVVVHPADAGVVAMRVRDAKAAAARMSFFMINTPS
jgi:4-hydroxyphenylpyruvate dioxygenase-like putative hemolysin